MAKFIPVKHHNGRGITFVNVDHVVTVEVFNAGQDAKLVLRDGQTTNIDLEGGASPIIEHLQGYMFHVKPK